MAEYIYCINPDKNTIREISEKDGIVVWNIPCAANKVTENDTIYLYINTGDTKNKNSYICYSGCIAYKATVLEVLADRNKKKLLKLHIKSLAPFATKELSKCKLGETDPANSRKVMDSSTNPPAIKYVFHPSQSYPIDLNTRADLKNYIDETLKKTDVIPAIPKTLEEKLICEFETVKEIFDGIANPDGNKKGCNKLNGNIASNIISKYIQMVIDKYDLAFRVSEPNVYIQGSKTEWDALILKKDAYNILGCNLYNPQDVVAVLEYKSSGIFYKVSDPEKASKPLKNIIESVNKLNGNNQNPISVGYITLYESEPGDKGENYFSATKEAFDNAFKSKGYKYGAFCFVNSRSKEEPLYKNEKCWDEFILSLLPKD